MKDFFLWCNLVYMMKKSSQTIYILPFCLNQLHDKWVRERNHLDNNIDHLFFILLSYVINSFMWSSLLQKIFYHFHFTLLNLKYLLVYIIKCDEESYLMKMDVELHISEMILYIQYLKFLDKDVAMKPLLWLFKF